MSTPRRRILRSSSNGEVENQQLQRQIEKLRTALAKERESLTRWQRRMRRAYTTVQKTQARITRLERQLTKLIGS